MLYLYTGTDRVRAREEMNKMIAKEGKKTRIVHVTDANSIADLKMALRGGGMFDSKRTIVLDGTLASEEMRDTLLHELPSLEDSDQLFFLLEGKLDAATRKRIEKHAEKTEVFDAPKGVKRGDIFVLAHAMSKGDKKALWVGYQRALARGEAAEAIHGVLFWGAKQMVLSGEAAKRDRGKKLVAELAELPHEARRQGFDLEYALEKHILSINKT